MPELDIQRVMSKAFALKQKGSIDAAIRTMQGFLKSGHRSPDVRSEGFGFLGSLYEAAGDLEHARMAYSKALSWCKAGSYSKYTLQIALGNLSEQLGASNEAAGWYLKALRTCQTGDGLSGGTALFRLFSLRRPSELSSKQLAMCKEIVRSSWKLLGISGTPPLARLQNAARHLVAAQSRPSSR